MISAPLIAELHETTQTDQFARVKHAIFETPYTQLPNYTVSNKHFGKSGSSDQNRLLLAARRTLQDDRDLIEFATGQKLFQANGICFAGNWQIDRDNDYTGLFRAGTVSDVIVRASVALSGTRQKDKRAFGMAIKLFPTDLNGAPSLNAFVLHSLGGIVTEHVVDLSMDNQPRLGRIPRWRDIPTALRIRRDLERADREQGANPAMVSFRPINHLASYRNAVNVSAPKWLRLSAKTDTRIDADDFREELRLEHYPDNRLIYAIEVAADNGGKKSAASWQHIGNLTLLESVTSLACDQKLHFKHPSLDQ